MPRKFSSTLGWLAALTVAMPVSAVLAQEPLPQTHTVRKGDTLWDLAQHYLKDPFLWPGIFRQNTDVVEDPHWIYPGEILRIAPVDNVAAVPTMDTPPPSAADTSAPSDSPDALAQGPQNTENTSDVGNDDVMPEDQPPLFHNGRAKTVAEILRSYTDQPYRPLRRSEFYSSGFLTENQRLPYGKVLGPVTPSQIKATNARANALPYTTVAVKAPDGATYEVGDSLLVLMLADEIDSYGRIVMPTGIAQITGVVDEHYLASIVATYGPIRNGQRVLPLETFTPGSGARAVPVADGVRGALLGGFGRQDLKEPQMVVFIDKGREAGVAPGDLFEVRRRPQRLSDGTLRVNEIMATLQIVHVRDRSATALVLNVMSPDIPPGTDVLQVAKLPS